MVSSSFFVVGKVIALNLKQTKKVNFHVDSTTYLKACHLWYLSRNREVSMLNNINPGIVDLLILNFNFFVYIVEGWE